VSIDDGRERRALQLEKSRKIQLASRVQQEKEVDHNRDAQLLL